MDRIEMRRYYARIICYADLVLQLLIISGLIGYYVYLGNVFPKGGISETGVSFVQDWFGGGTNYTLIILTILLAVAGIFSVLVLELLGIFLLFKATEEGIDPADARSKASFFRNMQIALFAISIIATVAAGNIPLLLGSLIIRGIFIVVASDFVTELSRSIDDPDGETSLTNNDKDSVEETDQVLV